MRFPRQWQRGRGWNTPWVALARFGNALYFLLTAAYCVLTYSSFAYQQFIRPRLVASLTAFIVWHPLWHWLHSPARMEACAAVSDGVDLQFQSLVSAGRHGRHASWRRAACSH